MPRTKKPKTEEVVKDEPNKEQEEVKEAPKPKTNEKPIIRRVDN